MNFQTDEHLDHEIILTIVNTAGELIGKFNVEKILNKMADTENALEGRALLFSFGNEIQKHYGDKGAFATMRQMGREVAQSMILKHKVHEWESILKEGLATLGFAQWIEQDDEKICLFGCDYYEYFVTNDIKPIEHSICWFGWGYTEGFMRSLKKGLVAIEFEDCSSENNMCCFKFK